MYTSENGSFQARESLLNNALWLVKPRDAHRLGAAWT